MSIDPLTAALNIGSSLIDKIWPDPTQAAAAHLHLQELAQKGDIAELNAHVSLLVGQMEVNKVEASHPSLLVAGWRPAVGWVGALSLFYKYIVYELLLWVSVMFSFTAPPSTVATALMPLLLGMLGIGGMRSYDKMKGKDTRGISK